MMSSYTLVLQHTATILDLQKVQEEIKGIVRYQVATHAPSEASECNSYGVDIDSNTLTDLRLEVSLPEKHDAWVLRAIKNMEYVKNVVLKLRPSKPSSSFTAGASKPIPNEGATFLTLPAELRHQIYETAFSNDPSVSDPVEVVRFKSPLPALSVANKQTHRESVGLAQEMRVATIAAAVGQVGVPFQGLGGVMAVAGRAVETDSFF